MAYDALSPLHTGKVEGSIPSVPTTKPLDLQGLSANSTSCDPAETCGTVREHGASIRGQDVEVCSADVLASIPTEPKAFEAWLFEQDWMLWPADLQTKADRARQSLTTKDQTAVGQSYAMRKAGIADWSAFTTAYAEHKAREAV